MNTQPVVIGILTASDRASSGVYSDISGKTIEAYFRDAIHSSCNFEYVLVSDDFGAIKNGLIQLTDKKSCHLVVTTGGTGPTDRDVTPEATFAVCSRMLPGFGERMRAESMKTVPTAILSRQTAGIRGSCLIINLPGKPAAIEQCLDVVIYALVDCMHLLGGPKLVLSKRADFDSHAQV